MHRLFCRCVLSLAAASLAALSLAPLTLAQTTGNTHEARLPLNFLKNKPIHFGLGTTGKRQHTAGLASSTAPGIDSLPTWSDRFEAPGFDALGNPQYSWPYTMVGDSPETGRTTKIHSPVIPVTVELLDKTGKVAVDGGTPLILRSTPKLIDDVLESPVFEPWIYTSGVGQLTDQMMRAQFWDRINPHDDNDFGWHTVLKPHVKNERVMKVPAGAYFYSLNLDGTCCAFALVDATAFSNLLFPPTYPVDNTTVIGAAELAGDMTTKDLSNLIFNNVFLYSNGDPNNCCTLGFHSADFEPGIPQNGNRERLYVFDFASWITPGLFLGGAEDVTAFSHEIAETYNDPFGSNRTPWWLSMDPLTGNAQCQDSLETGDVVEVLLSNPVFAISMNGRTYHPQNEAMLPWFAFQTPSKAHLHAYSFPDETTLLSLSPGPLLPGCQPAP